MTKVSGSWTAVGQTAWFRLNRGEELTYTIGSVSAGSIIVVERDLGGATKVEQTITEDATGGFTAQVKGKYRLRITTVADSDTVTYVAEDSNAVAKTFKNKDGEDVARVTDDGFQIVGPLLTDSVGTEAAGTEAVEAGTSSHHITTLTVDTALPAIAGGAALGVGKLLYTFPAGIIRINTVHASLAIQQTESNIDADTPDGGLGTVIASGAVSVLSGTATFENILTGQTFNDCDGTAETVSADCALILAAADPHTVYFNVADTWAASGDAAAGLAGTVILEWSKLS